MKRKRRVFYHVSVPGMWWMPEIRRWIVDPPPEYRILSSSRRLHTARRAFNYAAACPEGTVVTKFFYKGGKRYCLDFVRSDGDE